MSAIDNPTQTLDVQGQSCPMPVIKTKQAVDELEAGDVLAVLATDPGSQSDIRGWAEATDGVSLLEQREVDGVYEHFIEITG